MHVQLDFLEFDNTVNCAVCWSLMTGHYLGCGRNCEGFAVIPACLIVEQHFVHDFLLKFMVSTWCFKNLIQKS